MLASFLRSAIVLVALVVTYQVYVLTVAPFVEPPAVKRNHRTISQEQRAGSYDAIARYQALLAAYFPSDHWSLVTQPKVIRVDEMMFVLKDYQRNNNGTLDLEACVVLILPKEWQLGSPAPRETIILEAPGGAHLQFDEDFQPTRGKAGRIVRGEFPGTITVRSDMKLPGTEDDLFLQTSNLVMNETLIRTDSRVEARIGANRLTGRKMVVRLSRDEHIKRGPSINGLQSLEIYEEVELELQVGKPSNFNNTPDKMAERQHLLSASQPVYRSGSPIQLTAARLPAIGVTERKPAERKFNPPIRITCQGRFHFDLLSYVASFDQNVEVRRMRLDGPYDQLDCNELSVWFAAFDERGNPIDSSDDPDVARKQRAAVKSFKPVAIEATGNPVRAESAAEQASARAQRMRIDLLERRLTLDQGREVMLAYGATEMHAPMIEYQTPPDDSPRSVGELSIAGPGWLRAVPDKKRPDRVVDISWKRAEGVAFPVRIRRRRGEPVLMLAGDPVVDAHRLGKIQAKQMELLLREVPADGPEGPAFETSKNPIKLAVIPERLLAAGKVLFASPELTGQTHQLEATFEPWKPNHPGKAVAAMPASTGSSRRPDGRQPRDRQPPRDQYNLIANQIHLDLSLTGQRAEPTAATCDGAVSLTRVRTSQDDGPLEVRGEQLRVDGLDGQAKIRVTGRPSRAGNQADTPFSSNNFGGATIEARGMLLTAEQINADQQTGKFWINGPGKATLQIDAKMLGQQASNSSANRRAANDPPTPVTLTWQKGLDGAGQRIVIQGRVLAESQQGWVQADRAIALLTRPLAIKRKTGQRGTSNQKIEVAQVTLEGNVVMDHREVDEQGQQSHDNLQLRSVTFNQLTGEIKGDGPGTLRSVRLTDQSASFADLAGAGRQPATTTQPGATQPKAKEPELRFLRVDFVQGISGNMNQRVLRFHRRVRSVYGPVDDWQQELPLYDPDRLPPDSVTLACETLSVNEDPMGPQPQPGAKKKLGPIELVASENVEIEGRSDKQGLFQAQATTASYSQRKDLFVLQGDGQHDAVLRHRDAQTGQFVETPAGTIMYWASEPRVQLRDIHRPFDFQQNAPGNSPRNAVRPQRNR